ncbi:MAG: hypothetical protein ACOYOV_07845 [Bacteroidales bacterium]
MNFLKIKTSWSNFELALFKICVASIYLVIGIYFHEFLGKYMLLFVSIFVVSAIWVFSLWLKKMKKEE